MSLSRKHFVAISEDINRLMSADEIQDSRMRRSLNSLRDFAITSNKRIQTLIEIDLLKRVGLKMVFILRSIMIEIVIIVLLMSFIWLID